MAQDMEMVYKYQALPKIALQCYFSRNIGKLFSKLKLVSDNLLDLDVVMYSTESYMDLNSGTSWHPFSCNRDSYT